MKEYISDLLTRIRNGSKAKLHQINIHTYSPKSCIKILEILREEGYIWGFQKVVGKSTKQNNIIVYLKYTGTGIPAIQQIYMISKPGRRFYWTTKVLWKPKSSAGILILNTSKGYLTDKNARLFNIGGEVICGIY